MSARSGWVWISTNSAYVGQKRQNWSDHFTLDRLIAHYGARSAAFFFHNVSTGKAKCVSLGYGMLEWEGDPLPKS